MFFVKCCYNI